MELKLAAERKEADTVADDVALITNAAAGQTIPLYLDLSVIKTVIPTSGSATETRLVSVPKLLTVVFPLPGEAVGKQNITVYRVHNGKAEALPGRDSGANGEWAEINGNNAILHIRQFSTYAVGYTKPTPSGGGGVVSYPPVIRSGEHGTVPVSPKAPTSGNKVTITPKPDEGHAVGEVIVTDKNGKEIPIKDNGDGTFSYTQPSGKVTITVTFKPARPAWNPFVDVAEKDWFHDSVKYVYEHDLILGTSDTTFSPYWDTSRGMMITVLWRVEGSPTGAATTTFPDIAQGQYYIDAVTWGAENSIILGYDNGNYGPADPITREQLAAILWRYAKYKGYDVSVGEDSNILSYPDYPQISPYAIPALQWACGAGIMEGKGGGCLDPGGHATRAEAVTMLERFLRRLAE